MNSQPSDKTMKYRQAGVFVITFAIYSMLHASRTAWAYSKPTVSEELGYSDSLLGLFDCSFLCAYGFGLFFSGWLCDRMKLKTLFSNGMMMTVTALALFSMAFGFLGEKNIAIGIITFILNGLGQSTVSL